MADMTSAMALEIVAQATKYSAYEVTTLPAGANPGEMTVEEIKQHVKLDDDVLKRDAAGLVQLARNANDRGINTDGVGEILFAALVEPTKEAPNAYDWVYARHPDVTPPAPSDDSSPAASQPAATDGSGEASNVDINSIVPKYDDRKVVDLKKVIMDAAASGDLTEQEWEQIKAYESATEERKSILSLEPVFKKPEPAASAAPLDTSPTAGYASQAGLQAAYDSGALGTDRITQENIPIPGQYSGDEPVLPVDITQISPQDLSRLSMRFYSLKARLVWLASQEAGRRDVADHLARESWADAFKSSFEKLKGAIEKETAAAIDNARSEAKHTADVDETVRKWRNRSTRHAAETRSLDALVANHEDASVRLSREQTRREKLASS